jgi:hypothetical protein
MKPITDFVWFKQGNEITKRKKLRGDSIWRGVTPHVTLFPNYLHYKLSQVSSVMVNQVVEVQNQNSKSGIRI